MKKFQLILLSLLSITSVVAQDKEEIDAYVQTFMGGTYYHKMPAVFNDVQNRTYINTLLEGYRADKDEEVRGRVYWLIRSIAYEVDDTTYTGQLIEKLVLSQLDSLYYIRSFAEDIRIFNKSQFTQTAIDSLYKLFLPVNKDKISRQNILLIGFVGAISQCDSLYNYAKEKLDDYHKRFGNNQFASLKWASKLALARMGDKQMGQECINFMRKYKSDYSEYQNLCYYASYIRTNESIGFLVELLHEDGLDSPLDGDEIGYPLAHYAIDHLQSIIVNMPDVNKLNDRERIKVARKWMKENKGKYVINTEIFWVWK
ncbi:hypothetical protein FACS1894199_10800 [Bacteroidia bacterium]|nr:hypothetical protein FACS1894199_10800 [Bacteroidia bacterium]